MAQQRVFVFEGTAQPVQGINVFALQGAGFKVVSPTASELDNADATHVAKMFQAAHAWASKHEFTSAFPLFIGDGNVVRPQQQLVALTSEVAERFDVVEEELGGDPLSQPFGHYLRVAHDQARKRKFATGFPIFMWSGEPPGRVHHFVGIRHEHALWTVLNLPELGTRPEEDIPFRFGLVHRWATANGYSSALTTFHTRDWKYRSWGERTALTRAEQELNFLLEDGWRVTRIDPLKLSEERAALVYLLEK